MYGLWVSFKKYEPKLLMLEWQSDIFIDKNPVVRLITGAALALKDTGQISRSHLKSVGISIYLFVTVWS